MGGKRFRPCVEDVVEFLIVERLADGREGWREAVDGGRDSFTRIQAGAVARRYPNQARAALAGLDAQEPGE